jgi:hypothetical protein
MNIATPDKISMMAVSNGNLLRENDQNTINERAKYTANTGTTYITSANGELTGAGTLFTLLTARDNGTLIKTITIQSIDAVAEGIVRLFIYDGTSVTKLIEEFEIPPSLKTGTYPAYSISFDVNYNLKRDYVLKATAEQANKFVVIAEGLDWAY